MASIKVYFVQGHGEKAIFPDEPGMATAQFVKDELEKQHFQVDGLNLFQENEVPEAADVVVIAGPMRKFAANEVDALSKFLAAGGNILAMLHPETESNLENLMMQHHKLFHYLHPKRMK